MATNLKAVTDAMVLAVNGLAMTSPPPAPMTQTWLKTIGPENPDQLSAGDHDGHWDFDFPAPRMVAVDFGIAATQVIDQRVDVLLFRERTGDFQDFDIALHDDARAVADAVDSYGAYPAGTDVVLFKSMQVESPGKQNWVRMRLTFEVRFQAKYAAAL